MRQKTIKIYIIMELSTQFSAQKRFKQTEIITKDNETLLKSYNTIVAKRNNTTKEITVNDWYSMTTAKHINEFINQFGGRSLSKKEMLGGCVINLLTR